MSRSLLKQLGISNFYVKLWLVFLFLLLWSRRFCYDLFGSSKTEQERESSKKFLRPKKKQFPQNIFFWSLKILQGLPRARVAVVASGLDRQSNEIGWKEVANPALIFDDDGKSSFPSCGSSHGISRWGRQSRESPQKEIFLNVHIFLCLSFHRFFFWLVSSPSLLSGRNFLECLWRVCVTRVTKWRHTKTLGLFQNHLFVFFARNPKKDHTRIKFFKQWAQQIKI